MTWDTTLPLGSEAISNGDNRIRELKTDLQTALRGNASDGTEAKFPGSDTASPVFRYRGLKGITGDRPSAGQYGLYFDTTRSVLQRDNGSSWDDIGTAIPSGTVMVFFQASAPTGWTKSTAHDGKALRVVSGTGGGSGGSTDPGSTVTLAHTHTVASHTHTGPSHTHSISALRLGHSAGATSNPQYSESIGSNNSAGAQLFSVIDNNNSASGYHDVTNQTEAGTTGSEGTGNTGSASPATDSQLSNLSLAYINVIVCSKD